MYKSRQIPGTDKGFSTASCNSRRTQHPPSPVPPFLVVQNLSSKRIVPTDNMRLRSDDAKSIVGDERFELDHTQKSIMVSYPWGCSPPVIIETRTSFLSSTQACYHENKTYPLPIWRLYCYYRIKNTIPILVPSPPPQLSSLAVQITQRNPGKNYHMMYATDVIT